MIWYFLKAGLWNSCTFQLHGQQAKTVSKMPIGNVYVISAIAIVGGGLFGYASSMKEVLLLEEKALRICPDSISLLCPLS